MTHPSDEVLIAEQFLQILHFSVLLFFLVLSGLLALWDLSVVGGI